jgi:uncharacterized protein YxeA
MKKILSILIILVLLILPFSISFVCGAENDEDWKSIEQNGFLLSAKLNFNDDKTELESIDTKIENKSGEDKNVDFAMRPEPDKWNYSVRVFKNGKEIKEEPKRLFAAYEPTAEIKAGEVISDKITLKNRNLYVNTSGDYEVRLSTHFMIHNHEIDEKDKSWQMIIPFKFSLNESKLAEETTTKAEPTTALETEKESPVSQDVWVGIAMTLIIVAILAVTLIASNKKSK